MFGTIIPFIFLILVVVFVHEYGHYYYAKKYGVGVTDFSIGFGKEIFGWNDNSGTRWKICWIPLGGYVKFFGDRNVFGQADQEEILKKYNTKERKKLFILKPLYQRFLIVLGGPLANFILAIVIYSLIFMFVGKDLTPAKIAEVHKDSPAEVAGLLKNDLILEIDGRKVNSILDVSKYIMSSTNESISFKVKRYENDIFLYIKPKITQADDGFGSKVNKKIVGITIIPNDNINNVKLGPTKAIYYSINEVYFITSTLIKHLGQYLVGKGDTSQLGGPIKIAQISGKVFELGFVPFLSVMAYISVSLGFINLLPIPLLDGGHLMFYSFEGILGRPLRQKTQEFLFRIGMFLLVFLMFFATYNDIIQIISF
jgi:regulator of sigma E protease